MKRIALISIFIFVFCSSVLPQKLTEPQYLGSWVAGEDPSEFLLHRVMEYSEILLKENPEGKLIVRLCSLDKFSTAFVKAPLNLLKASAYNLFTKRIIVSFEKIFIANSSKCLGKEKFDFIQYWFIPDAATLEYDEIFPVNNIDYKSLWIDDYDFDSNKNKITSVQEKEFAENITEFTAQLKNNPKAEGFITYFSHSRRIKRNLEKIMTILGKENINLQRVKILMKTYLVIEKNNKLKRFKDKKEKFPSLEILTIKP